MCRVVVLLALALTLGLPAGALPDTTEQEVVPLNSGEQQVEVLAPEGEQQVQALDEHGVQELMGNATKSPARRGADTAVKVVVGVLAGAVAVGATVASLLFL